MEKTLMDKKKKTIDTSMGDQHENAPSQNFVLRIWKIGDNSFKGYLLDPLTNMRYPLRNTSINGISGDETIQSLKGVMIESLGCWVGVWHEANEVNDPS